MKRTKPVNRLCLDPRETLKLLAAKGYRKASEELACSRGKLFDLREANPELYDELCASTEKESARPAGSKAHGKSTGDIPATWRPAAAIRSRLVKNQQQDTLLKILFGRELLRAKAAVAHGAWIDELKRYCPWDPRSAERFMRVAGECVPATYLKFDRLSNLTRWRLPRKAINAIKAIIAGRSFDRLYKDLFPGSSTKAKDKSDPAIPSEAAVVDEPRSKPSGEQAVALQPAKPELAQQQSPTEEIAHLISRVREFARSNPEASEAAAKVELSLKQAQIAVAAAHELLTGAGNRKGAPLTRN